LLLTVHINIFTHEVQSRH